MHTSRCYRRHLMEECNIGFLRLFDSFLETAPQKVLQLAIVLQNTKSLTCNKYIAYRI